MCIYVHTYVYLYVYIYICTCPQEQEVNLDDYTVAHYICLATNTLVHETHSRTMLRDYAVHYTLLFHF